MKVRITKVPDKKQDSLNARKWKHGDGGPIDNYFYDGGPYGVIPLGGDYLTYLQTMPEVSGGTIEPSVVTAALPAKFNGSQEAARRYAEGYQKGAKPVSEAMNQAGIKAFKAADTVAGFVPGPIGMIDWLGHMGVDAAEGRWGRVGRDVALATALGAGAAGIGWLRNYIDDATNFGEDIFRAFTDPVPGRISTNFTYELPATRNAIEEAELARELRMDQLGVDVPIRPVRNAEWSPEELARLRAMAGDHPMGLAAYTPEQIAQAQAQMQADAPIIHDALAGNRATGSTERFVSSGPVAGVKTTSGYQIERYPGYMLKSLMEGNPLEKQLSKSGEINVGNLRNYIKSKDIKAVDKAVMEKVLASEEFAGQKSIDYNKFRKAVQDELIAYERTPDTRWSDYGLGRIGLSFGNKTDVRNAEDRMYMLRERIATRRFRNGEKLTESDIADAKSELKEMEAFWSQIPKTDTYTFSSPRIPNGSGKHYEPNTLGHSRTYTTADEPDVLHVMESQSDWAQQRKGGIQLMDMTEENFLNDKAYFEQLIGDMESKGIAEEEIAPFRDELSKLTKNYKDHFGYNSENSQLNHLIDNYTSRQIQENLRYAAEKGQTKMRYPTRETAAKIEGYPFQYDVRYASPELQEEHQKLLLSLNDKMRARQKEIRQKYDFPKDYLDTPNRIGEIPDEVLDSMTELELKELQRRSKLSEKFDNSDTVLEMRREENKMLDELADEQRAWEECNLPASYNQEHETVLKKYDAFPKQFKKLYKNADIRTVTDHKGNTWYEVDVPEGYLQQEWAYEDGGSMILPKMMMDKHSPDKLRKAIANIKARRAK